MPSSITRMIVCRIAERIRFEPALPSTSSGAPSRSTTVGDIMLGIRRPGGWRWKPSGLRSCSPSMLFRCTPVPGTTTPEHDPFEQVTEHAQPSRSSTATWVVDPSGERRARNRLTNSGSSSPSRNSGVRSACVRSIASTTCATSAGGRARFRVEQRERVGDQDPAGRRRRVRDHLPPAIRHPDRVRGRRPRRRRDPSAVTHAAARRRASRRSPPRRRPCRTAPPPRRPAARARRRAPAGGRRRRLAATRPSGANSAAHSGVEVTIPARISITYACGPLSSTPSRASFAAGATSSASGIRPNRERRLAHARRHPVRPDRRGADVEHLDRVAERHADRDELASPRRRRRRAPAPRRRSRAAPAPARARPRACSRRRRGRSAAARRRTTRASPRARRRPRCRRCAARRRRRARTRGWPAATTPSGSAITMPVASAARDELRDVELECDHGALPHAADARLAGGLAQRLTAVAGGALVRASHPARLRSRRRVRPSP